MRARLRRFLPHRLAVVVVLLSLVIASAGFFTVRKNVEDQNHQLLEQKADELAGLMESVVDSFKAGLGNVAVVPEITGGDPTAFAEAVGRDTQLGDDDTWVLLDSQNDFRPVTSVGPPALADWNDPRASWVRDAQRATKGEFTAIGFVGEGLGRRIAMVSGRPGGPSRYVVYNEVSLIAAAAQSASDEDNSTGESGAAFENLAIGLYLWDTPIKSNLVFELGETGEGAVVSHADLEGTEVTFVVDTTGPLAGTITSTVSWALLILGGIAGLGVAAAVEFAARRRDDAMVSLQNLEAKNVALDRALSEQRQAEANRLALEAQLRQAQRLEAVGQLAGGVAHDFNNLLAAILSYADLAADDASDEATMREDLEEIRRAARRGADLTRQLLQFSRREHPEIGAVDINASVDDVARLLERTIGEDITLQVEPCAESCVALADAREIDQVLMNLVVNARDAVTRGGTITITTGVADLSAVDASRLPIEPGSYVRLIVSDDGCGMDAETRDHAFDPFFTTKGRGQGTGLGLATVYGIVQRSGGYVDIESAPGEGTTISILLPSAPLDAPVEEVLVDVEALTRAGGGETILLVEDEAPVRKALRRMLERAGYNVLEAPDGVEAVARHAGADIDLLLSDMLMPGDTSGADVAREMRRTHSGLPVVYVTGYSADLLASRGVDAEHDVTVLRKPFSEQELLATVAGALAMTPTEARTR